MWRRWQLQNDPLSWMAVDPINLKEDWLMRIVAAFVLVGGARRVGRVLDLFLVVGCAPGVASQSRTDGMVEEAATPTPDWTGKLTATVSQAVVLRAAPVPAAPVAGMLRRGDIVALVGCDTDVLWCQTEDESWLLSYMVDALPAELPILGAS
jgi:hypothetical protein